MSTTTHSRTSKAGPERAFASNPGVGRARIALHRRVEPNATLLFSALKAALGAEGLPTQDLTEPGRAFFAFYCADKTLAGFAGFEVHGRDVLVRSMVVLPGHRGKGLARPMVEALLAEARRAGADRAWLLTETAAAVFERLGFEPASRDRVPKAIAATRQFATLCSARAHLMSRSLPTP